MSTSTITAPKPDKGWQTSEFWMATVTAVIVGLNSAFGWGIDPTAIATVAGMIAAYALSRAGVKAAAAVTK